MKRKLIIVFFACMALSACNADDGKQLAKTELLPKVSTSASAEAQTSGNNEESAHAAEPLNITPETSNPPQDTQQHEGDTPNDNIESPDMQDEISESNFADFVRNIIEPSIGKNETIRDVSFTDRHLKIDVELGEDDKIDLSREIFAFFCIDNIAEEFLKYPKYDDMWDIVTIDFGDVGSVKFNKDNIINNGFGRYFSYDELSKTPGIIDIPIDDNGFAIPTEKPMTDVDTSQLVNIFNDLKIEHSDLNIVQESHGGGIFDVSYGYTDIVWDESNLVRSIITDYINFSRKAFLIDGVNAVEFSVYTKMMDMRGNSSMTKVATISMPKEKFELYDWDNIAYNPSIYDTFVSDCSTYWLHLGISQKIKPDKIYYAGQNN